MRDKNPQDVNEDVLSLLLEYCKYLYEEEKARTERIEKKVNVFVLALGASVISILLKIPNSAQSTANMSLAQRTVPAFLFSMSILLMLASFIFTFFVYRVRDFERLSDPKKMSEKAVMMSNKSDMLSALIADYIVATNKNHQINDTKAKHLRYALALLFAALLAFIIGLINKNISLLM